MAEQVQKQEWVKERQKLIWEPEIIISGIVLIGLLQVPKYLEGFERYLNDMGPSIFYTSDLDEILVVFLKTSIYFLLSGLIFTLFMRSVWVVMVAMSFLFPEGVNYEKFKFQPFYKGVLASNYDFHSYVLRLEKICSLLYTLTFFSFMCIIGMFFFLLVIGLIFILIYSFIPLSPQADVRLNTILNFTINLLGGLYLLDFITLGLFKRIKWWAKIYRPIYIIMSYLTLSPLYRNIYYGLISRFNRGKIFTGLILFIGLSILVISLQRNPEIWLNQSEIHKNSVTVSTFDGYYRDKDPEKISSRLHIPSATVDRNVLEVFIPHKVALESSIFNAFEKFSGHDKEAIMASDSLRLAALSHYYRFRLDGQEIEDIPFKMMNYSRYNQTGMMGFIDLQDYRRGQYSLELYYNNPEKQLSANLLFYKIND